MNAFLIINIEPEFSEQMKKVCNCKRRHIERAIRKAKLGFIKKELEKKGIRYEDMDLIQIKALDIPNESVLEGINHIKEVKIEK